MPNYTKLLRTIRESLSLSEHIEKQGDKWVVKSDDYSKTLGTYNSKEAAEKRLREVEYFKNESTDIPGWKQIAVMEDDDEQNGAYFTCPSCHYEFPGKAGRTAPCPLCGSTARFTASIHEQHLTERDSNRGQAYLVTLAGPGGREETKTIYAATPADARAKVKAFGDKVLDVETIPNNEMNEAANDFRNKMTLNDWLAKYHQVARPYGTGGAVLVGVGNSEAQWDLFHLKDWIVSSAVSGPGYVLIPRPIEESVDEDPIPEPDSSTCPFCGGEGMPMGTLANRTFYRCRNCGRDSSVQGIKEAGSLLSLFGSKKTYAMVRSPWGNSQTKKEIKRGEDGNLYALTDRGWNRLTTDDYGQLYLTNEDLATNAKPEEDDGTDLGNDIYRESWSGMVLNDQLNRMGQQLNEATAMEFVRKLKNLNVQVGISIVHENDIVHLILDGPPDGVRDATDMANDDGLTTERTLPMKGGTHRVIVSGFGR